MASNSSSKPKTKIEFDGTFCLRQVKGLDALVGKFFYDMAVGGPVLGVAYEF